jgi:hypothetical protein
MSEILNYGKIYNVGHRIVADIFKDPVQIEEKVDGSQFSFGVYDGELRMRSRGKQIDIDAPDNLFVMGVAYVKSIADRLEDGFTYRCEYLCRPKHNSIAYDNMPTNMLVLFDVDIGEQNYLLPEDRKAWAEELEIDCIPVFHQDIVIENPEQFRELLETESFLGGAKVEGVVIKNYTKFDVYGKTLRAKYVSEAFKELNDKTHKVAKHMEIKATIAGILSNEKRYLKAVQALRDEGRLEHDVKDIGNIFKQVSKDLDEECEDMVKDMLYQWAKKDIIKMASRGIPDWYKNWLLEEQFND